MLPISSCPEEGVEAQQHVHSNFRQIVGLWICLQWLGKLASPHSFSMFGYAVYRRSLLCITTHTFWNGRIDEIRPLILSGLASGILEAF
jgi:hypothetical protein